MAPSASGQATGFSTRERRVQLPPALCFSEAVKFLTLRSIGLLGRRSTAERVLDKRKTLVRLQPSLCTAADGQRWTSGLWPREVKASSEFDSRRSP